MKRGYLVALSLLAVLTLLSLALNGVTILSFLQLRRIMHRAVKDVQISVSKLADDTFSYTVAVDQEIPVSTEIPLNETLEVPINTVVPDSTTVVVPVNLGFRTYELAVPIEAVFPIDMSVSVPVSQTVDVTTVVPLKVNVPVDFAVSETPLVDYLEDLNAALKRIEERLDRPIWQSVIDDRSPE
jgi:hypothetical protein